MYFGSCLVRVTWWIVSLVQRTIHEVTRRNTKLVSAQIDFRGNAHELKRSVIKGLWDDCQPFNPIYTWFGRHGFHS